MALEVSTITAPDELDALRRPWLGLLERADNELPFLQPEWMSSWWRTFHQRGRLIRDSLRVTVVRDGAGEVLGIVPLMTTERPHFGPLRARSVGFIGADRYVTEQRAPIVDPARQVEVARALASHLLGSGDWDWLAWHGLDAQSAFARELDRAMPLEWGEAVTASVLPLPASWEEFRGGLKRNIKESLRRCSNSLKRDGHTARLVVVERPDELGPALDTFFTLHRMRSQQVDALPHPDRFAEQPSRRFLRQVCGSLAARGVARVLLLEVDGTAVAARVAFQMPGCLYLYYSGYDPAWSKYSVATTIVAETIRHAIGRGVPRLHLSMGQDVSKSRWGPETTLRHDATWVRRRLSSRAARELYTWGRQSAWLDRTLGGLLPKRRFD